MPTCPEGVEIPTLMRALEEGAIKPAVAATRPLAEIREAQTAFLEKHHVGPTKLGQVIGDGAADDAASDHDDTRMGLHRILPWPDAPP